MSNILGSGSTHHAGRFARPLALAGKQGGNEPTCQRCLQASRRRGWEAGWSS